jgi:flagellar basal-body rod modification protein FlgD
MATISSTTGVGAAAPVPNETASTKLNADYQMFLKLLTTQMQNQDPLDPMDSSEYTQQLVQFSAVEQSIEQTTALKAILARLGTGDVASASALIGRDVQFASAQSGLAGESPARWAWSVDGRAESVSAEIRNSLGRKVATIALDPASTGGTLDWAGELPGGGTAPDGAYTLSLVAKAADGSDINARVSSMGRVRDVVVENGTTLLGVNGVNLPFSSVTRVTDSTTAG